LSNADVDSQIETEYGAFSLGSSQQRMKIFREWTAIIKSLPNREAQSFLEQLYGQLSNSPVSNHVLGREELRRLASEGVTLGTHTQTQSPVC